MTKMIPESYSSNIIIGKMCSILHVKAQKSLLTRGYIRENGLSTLMTTQLYRARACNAERTVQYLKKSYTGGST